jgi:hypothetical protein
MPLTQDSRRSPGRAGAPGPVSIRLTLDEGHRSCAAVARTFHQRSLPACSPMARAGNNLRPDPLAASTAAELMAALRARRIWGGLPGFRMMSMRAGHRASPSTMCTALKGDKLPSLDVVRALVEGSGGDKEEVKLYATAWRDQDGRESVNLAAITARRPGPQTAAPQPRRRLWQPRLLLLSARQRHRSPGCCWWRISGSLYAIRLGGVQVRAGSGGRRG